MNEVEKMYSNAGINKIGIKRCSGIKQGICQHNCNECESFDYKHPPFTAEKQIELIKWLARKDNYSCNYSEIKPRDNNEEWMSYSVFKAGFAHSFEESLAKLINSLWQDLTEEERKQIKEILE